jgi:hypothetical protein
MGQQGYRDRFRTGFRRRTPGRSAEVDLEKPLASATWVTPGRIPTRDYPDDPRHPTSATLSTASHTSPAEGTQDQLQLNGRQSFRRPEEDLPLPEEFSGTV